MPIQFHNADIRFSFKQKKAIKLFLEKQLIENAKSIRLDYIFCSDEYLLDINRKFLRHDYYTDVITFPISEQWSNQASAPREPPPRRTGSDGLGGEIYISIDRVKENAKKLQLEFDVELLRVMFHGVLHLLGHKDKTKAQKTAMRTLEEKWLRLFHKQ